ncbi:hypothetical protein KP509_09G060200 [Ceratopteris richardii]|uniref:Uncharacterized protein n=1 Tax=Ceratopteris richardii TaxID=49495 RepID=A0A8T2U8E4_CERRI|nr:hypothetical protein KP509_09G060200 [Ceratopteris richardii]
MGSKWKKLRLLLSSRSCMSSTLDTADQPEEGRHDDRIANTQVIPQSHTQPLSKSSSHIIARRPSFDEYHTGPMNILDSFDVGPSPTSNNPTSFSGPITSERSGASVFRAPRRTCSICLESMTAGQGHALFTAECSHTFHFSCIASNVRHGNQICPICRAKWKDLPWQHGQNGSKNNKSRNNSYRRALSNVSDASSLDTSEILNNQLLGHGFYNYPFQHLDDSVSHGLVHLNDPASYDDDEPLSRSSSSELPSGRINAGFCGQKMHVKMFPEVSAVLACEARQCFTVLVHLKAPAARSATSSEACTSSVSSETRAPVDLVAVLDVSGSMAGRKLSLLKQAMCFVIHNLSAADRLSVVVFSSMAKRIFPLRRMGEEGQRQALQAVDALIATGGTNIGEGLLKGVRVLKECREKNPVSSIMLLSDGQDTFNMNSRRQLPLSLSRVIPDAQSLVPQSITTSAGTGQMHIPVHTFGFGADHDSAAMHMISEVTGGTFSYIQAEEVVQDAFAQCIGGLLSVVTQDVQLTVSCMGPDVFIGSIHSGSYDNSVLDSAKNGIIKLGDLYAEEERDVLVDLNLPALLESEESLSMSIMQAACIYKDPVTKEVIQSTTEELSIMRPLAVKEEQQLISLEVDRQRNRLNTAEAITNARLLADQGDIEAAQHSLQNARAHLGASPSARAGDQLCHMLESELDEIEERMANRQLYERSGRAYVLSAQSSHLRQRATTRGGSVDCHIHDYQTTSMIDMISLSQMQLAPEAGSSVPTRQYSSRQNSTNEGSSLSSGRPLLRKVSARFHRA